MNLTPVLVRLPEDHPVRIDALVGKQRRAEFIRNAVEAALKNAELIEGSIVSTGPSAGNSARKPKSKPATPK